MADKPDDYQSSEEKLEARLEQCYRRLGTRTPRCPCGETNPLALTGRHPNIRCYECLAVKQGRNPIEQHHVIGQRNDPNLTAPIPGNSHRILSDLQNFTWPQETLRNPDESPLIKIAAAAHAFLDFLRMLIDYVLGWVPGALESLDARLCECIGPQWWQTINWQAGPA